MRFRSGANAGNCDPDLNNLTDQELRDIGIARVDIEYVAANRSMDPRGIQS